MHGQTRLEFIFGIVIFSIVIFYVVNQMNNTFSTIISDYDINNVKAEANDVVEILTNEKGYPENWNNFLSQGWDKRRKIELSASSKELINQQIRINITKYTGMNSDYSDIRFTDSDKVTSLPYWIENYTSSYVVVWVKVPKILKNEKKIIYVYYSNSGIATESSGNNVFIQFLDLSGSSLPEGWIKTDVVKSGTATVSNGILKITNNGGSTVWQNTYEATHVYKNSKVSGNFVAVAKLTGQKNTDPWAEAGITVQNLVEAKKYNGMSYISVTPGNGYSFEWQSSPSYNATDKNSPSGTVTFPTYLKLIRNSSFVSGWNSIDGTIWNQRGSYVVPLAIANLQYVTLIEFPHNSGAVGEANFSMFYVYQYAYPEPTTTIKNEEIRTNESWYPIRTIGFVDQDSVLSKDKITSLNQSCDFLSNFKIKTYRLKVYNSTSLLLLCGTESLRPAKVVVNKYVFIGNDLGNITLEVW